jgi:predicted acylesterase/phospholipase RssA
MSSHIWSGNSSRLDDLVSERRNLPIDFGRAEIFSGGGCKGFYYIGYLKAKQELGLGDTDIGSKSKKFGVSIGSLFSTINAIGWPAEEVGKYVKSHPKIMKHLFSNYTFPPFNKHISEHKDLCPTMPNGKLFSNQSLVSTEPLEEVINYFVGDLTFKDLKDLTIAAFEWSAANSVYFNSETFPDIKVKTAILASAAVPGVFPMVEIIDNGVAKYLSDGGGGLNLPIDISLMDRRVKNIVAIDLINTSKHNRAAMPKNALDMYLNAGFVAGSEKTRSLFKYVLHRDYEQSIEDKIFKVKVYEEKKDGKVFLRYLPSKKNIMFVNPNIDAEYFVKTDPEHLEDLAEQGYRECKPLLERFQKFK